MTDRGMTYMPPLSSGEFEITVPTGTRTSIVSRNGSAALLSRKKYDAMLLRQPCNFAWLTSGAQCPLHAGLNRRPRFS